MKKRKVQDMLFNNLRVMMICLLVTLVSCNNSDPTIREIDSNETPDDEQPEENLSGTIRDITSRELITEMGTGWNLGNSFDVTDEDKTAWGYPLPT